MAYIYDPSQQISQSLGQTAKGVGNIFAQVIAEKQQDFQLAQDTEANIQALKKDLNKFSQNSITNKANDLLGKTRASIFKDGKLDYSKLREIRNQISSISDLKTGYDLAAQEYENRLKLGISTKDEITSFTKYMSELASVLADENAIMNPQDLAVKLDNVYYDNLDPNKTLRKNISNYFNTEKFSREVKDAQGNIVTVAVDTYNIMTPNQKGEMVINEQLLKERNISLGDVYKDMVSNNPGIKKLIERQFGVGANILEEVGPEEIMKKLILMTSGTPSSQVKKTIEEQTIEKAKATIAAEEMTPEAKRRREQKEEAEISATRAQAARNWAAAASEMPRPIDVRSTFRTEDYLFSPEGKIGGEEVASQTIKNSTVWELGAPIKMTIAGKLYEISTAVKGGDGNYYVSGIDLTTGSQTLRQLKISESSLKNNLYNKYPSEFRMDEKEDRQAEVNAFFGAEKSENKEAGKTPTKPFKFGVTAAAESTGTKSPR